MVMPTSRILGDLCKASGCTRSKDGFYNRCSLVSYFTHDVWMAKIGMVSREPCRIAQGKRVDARAWLFADAVRLR